MIGMKKDPKLQSSIISIGSDDGFLYTTMFTIKYGLYVFDQSEVSDQEMTLYLHPRLFSIQHAS